MTGRWRGLLVCVAALAAGCAAPTRPDWPPAPTVVDVRLEDHRFAYDAAIPAGRVVFRVRNLGTVEHELQLFPLDENLPPIAEQLRGSERRVVIPLAGVPHRPPGRSGIFAADLVAGRRYSFLCLLRDETGQSRALRGMASEFRAFGSVPS